MLQATHPKTCEQCGQGFIPRSTLARICGKYRCVAGFTKGLQTARKVDLARRKEAVKTRSEHQNETQKACNAYIRARDAELPCVSCGRFHLGQWHAGHYLSVGARPELRFDEQNIQKQCQPCNVHLHGNLVAFRAELSIRIGAEALARLEGPQTPKKYTVAELQALKADFRARTRALLKERETCAS